MLLNLMTRPNFFFLKTFPHTGRPHVEIKSLMYILHLQKSSQYIWPS